MISMAGPFEEALPWLYYHQAGIDTVLLPLRSMTEIKDSKEAMYNSKPLVEWAPEGRDYI